MGTARTDATGRFSLGDLRAGEQYLLAITADHVAVANEQRVVTAGTAPI